MIQEELQRACKAQVKVQQLSDNDIAKWTENESKEKCIKQKNKLEAKAEKSTNNENEKQGEEECKHCMKWYKNKNSLKKHISVKHNTKGDTVKCVKCNKDISRNNISKHAKLCKK
jgi:hypothetical protein